MNPLILLILSVSVFAALTAPTLDYRANESVGALADELRLADAVTIPIQTASGKDGVVIFSGSGETMTSIQSETSFLYTHEGNVYNNMVLNGTVIPGNAGQLANAGSWFSEATKQGYIMNGSDIIAVRNIAGKELIVCGAVDSEGNLPADFNAYVINTDPSKQCIYFLATAANTAAAKSCHNSINGDSLAHYVVEDTYFYPDAYRVNQEGENTVQYTKLNITLGGRSSFATVRLTSDAVVLVGGSTQDANLEYTQINDTTVLTTYDTANCKVHKKYNHIKNLTVVDFLTSTTRDLAPTPESSPLWRGASSPFVMRLRDSDKKEPRLLIFGGRTLNVENPEDPFDFTTNEAFILTIHGDDFTAKSVTVGTSGTGELKGRYAGFYASLPDTKSLADVGFIALGEYNYRFNDKNAAKAKEWPVDAFYLVVRDSMTDAQVKTMGEYYTDKYDVIAVPVDAAVDAFGAAAEAVAGSKLGRASGSVFVQGDRTCLFGGLTGHGKASKRYNDMACFTEKSLVEGAVSVASSATGLKIMVGLVIAGIAAIFM